MTKTKCITIGKFEKNAVNEDAVRASKNLIAVSDGAGGGGLFADRWSKYLLKNLPAQPICTADQLDEWIGSIWERFYLKTEEAAKRLGGMALDKFYDEGAFATLAAVWKLTDGTCRWMTYGDSVVFRYDSASKILCWSFSSLSDFSMPPYLINCKDELDFQGFRCGEFKMTKDTFVFVTSDALAHYIIMMYELSQPNVYTSEIESALHANSKNSNLLKKGMAMGNFKFEKEVIEKIRTVVYNKSRYRKWLNGLYNKRLLALDDYSLAVMYDAL